MKSEDLSSRFKKIYNKEAKNYEKTRFGSLKDQYAKRVKNSVIISKLKLANYNLSECKVIDIAAGTGRIAIDIARETGSNVFVADISIEMLKMLKEIKEKNKQYKIHLTLADMRYLPFENNEFDVVTLGSFLYLIPLEKYSSYVEDIARILKPEGIFICEVSNALCISNPFKYLKVFYQKNIKQEKLKSYAYSWNISSLFPKFNLEEIIGVEYPMFSIKYKIYEQANLFLGRLIPTKYFGGKYILIFRKSL